MLERHRDIISGGGVWIPYHDRDTTPRLLRKKVRTREHESGRQGLSSPQYLPAIAFV